MATEASAAAGYRADQSFFVKMATFLAILIVFGFAQFAARGFVNYGAAPIWVHLHGALMLSLIALFVAQNRFAASGNMAQHRRLGWIGAYLVAALVGLGCYTGVMAIRLHRVPPFFTDAYFLALTQVGTVVFGGMVYAAITRRKETDYHRRLMMGSMIAITEPAFGRLLPMPLLGAMSEWVVLAIQLVMVGAIALHDRKVMGHIHPATATVGAIIAMTHVLVELSARNPNVQSLAASIAGG